MTELAVEVPLMFRNEVVLQYPVQSTSALISVKTSNVTGIRNTFTSTFCQIVVLYFFFTATVTIQYIKHDL